MNHTPHHLVGIIDPKMTSICEYNAADWRNDALYVIQKLTASSVEEEEAHEQENALLQTIVDDKVRRDKIDHYIMALTSTSTGTSDTMAEKILPIVTGGTMMYLQWLVHGCPDAVKPTKEALSRAADIIQLYQDMDIQDNIVDTSGIQKGWNLAVQQVSTLGSIFAERALSLSDNDWYRLRRTLEVALTVLPSNAFNHIMTQPFLLHRPTTESTVPLHTIDTTDFLNHGKVASLYSGQRQGGLDTFNYDVRCFFLCPDDRMTHSKIVDCRCEDMVLAGLISETTHLFIDGSLPDGGQQTRAIGYRQTLDYLQRKDFKEKDEQAFSTYLDEFTTATRRYAKKQMQWFRKDEAFVFIPVQLSEDKPSTRVEAAAAMIRDMCIKSRDNFEAECMPSPRNDDDSRNKLKKKGEKRREWSESEYDQGMSISAKTKLMNSKQSEGMKFYINKRFRFVDGSHEMDRVIEEADQCIKALRCHSNMD